jgi:UDP:flavonoid glycosyltransferase YjiC (YdhE family)
VEVVLAVSNADKVRGRVPAAVRVIESMPLHLLLPACSVLVHRGGSGATLTAIARGVPQYILPAVADGQLNGELLARRGAALTADVDEIGPDDFADGVAALVHDEGFRRVTGELRAEMDRQPAPAAVVAALEQWA